MCKDRSGFIVAGGVVAAFLVLGALALSVRLDSARTGYDPVTDRERHGWRCYRGKGWHHRTYGRHPFARTCWR